jgi:hypothetical protein
MVALLHNHIQGRALVRLYFAWPEGNTCLPCQSAKNPPNGILDAGIRRARTGERYSKRAIDLDLSRLLCNARRPRHQRQCRRSGVRLSEEEWGRERTQGNQPEQSEGLFFRVEHERPIR